MTSISTILNGKTLIAAAQTEEEVQALQDRISVAVDISEETRRELHAWCYVRLGELWWDSLPVATPFVPYDEICDASDGAMTLYSLHLSPKQWLNHNVETV